jgi:transcriptional regulator with GAF, ATPase, and Fis domain
MVLKGVDDHFAAVARALRSQPSELTTMNQAVNVATEIVPSCDYAGITLVRNRDRVETLAVSDHGRASDALQIELGEGPSLDVLRATDLVFAIDLVQESRWSRWAPRAAHEHGVRSVLSCRLFTASQNLGALTLYSVRPDAFDARDRVTALAFAAHLAVAVASSRDIDTHGQGLMNRTVIGQAEGLLMERFGLSPEQAFTYLKRVSQDTNTKLTEVAAELVRTRITPGGAGHP